MLAFGWLGEIAYFLPIDRKFYQSFLWIVFLSFYKTAESVTQQIRKCPCKTKMATTGTRPPLVPSQYTPSVYVVEHFLWKRKINLNLGISKATSYRALCRISI